MKEWTNKYNPFNSWKALTHAEHFKAILKGEPLPPIVINIDLTNKCNYKCRFCMFGGQRERMDKQSQDHRFGNASLPLKYSLKLPKIWKEWGVKAVCLAGGGEPTLHADCRPFIEECGKNGLDLGFVTNGYLVNENWWKLINQHCKFVGFSIDAGTPEDYAKVKGVKAEQFDKVIANLKGIADTKGNVQIGYKFLLDRYNQNSIYKAAKIGRDIGCNHFQFRPAIDNYVYSEGEIDNIWQQINNAQRDFESDDYQVFGVQHKFNSNLSRKHLFEKCRATMLTSTWAADGSVYMCTDSRGNNWSKLVDHYPNPKNVIDYWGSESHFYKVNKINFKKNCDRCTLTAYNEFFEQIFIKDKMDRMLI